MTTKLQRDLCSKHRIDSRGFNFCDSCMFLRSWELHDCERTLRIRRKLKREGKLK